MKIRSCASRSWAQAVALASGVSILALGISSPVAAQTSAEQAEAPAAPEGAADEIVVTAQFRSQRLQDTPLAISAVNAASMEARNQVSIADVANSTPSVSITANASGGGPAVPVITIRGIGQTDAIGGVEPGVGVYVDDVYYGILNGAVFELVDLDRVEVLRGPQGTLAGKNSAGGSIKLYSQAPDEDFAGSLELSYGSFNRTQVRGSLNIPIVDDSVMLRVSGVYRHEDGYVDRLDYRCVNPAATDVQLINPNSLNNNCVLGTAGGQDLAAVRASLRLVLADGIENTIIADRVSDHHGADAAVQLFQGPWAGGHDFIGGLQRYQNYASFVGYLGKPQQYQAFIGNNADQWGISNRFTAELGDDLNLTSITAFRETDAHGSHSSGLAPYTPIIQESQLHHEQFSQELRLSGSVGDLADFTVGAFYYRGDSLMPNHIDLLGGGFPGGGIGPDLYLANFRSLDPIDTTSKSGFAHVVAHLAPDLNLTGGLRFTSESKTYTFHRYAVDNGGHYILNDSIAALDGLSSRYSGERWDWRVAVDYRIVPEVMVYAQAASGFKGGGINPRPYFTTQAAPYDPETVVTYEGGFKSDLFNRALRFNVSAFFSEFSDMQLIVNQCDSVSPFPGAPCQQTTNGGSSELWGAEVEATLKPVDGLTIDASGSFLDFRYKSVNPATGIPIFNTLPFLVKTKVTLGAQYEIPLLGGVLTPRIDLNYQSGFEVDSVDQGTFHTPVGNLTAHVPSFTLVNARISYRPDDADWEIAATVQNMFDEYYFTNKYDFNTGTAGYASAQGYVGRPRTWEVGVKYRF